MPECCSGLASRAIDCGGRKSSMKAGHGIGALPLDRLRFTEVCGATSPNEATRAIHLRVPRIMRSVRLKAAFYLVAVAFLAFGQISSARCEKLIVSEGWVQVADEIGIDIPLSLTIRNEDDAPDALLRARCPVTNFSEKHTVDHGEGAPAMRSIPSIPIPPKSTVVLSASEYHVMLLQTRRPLTVDERFVCVLVFQKAGAIEAEVEVRRSP
jgi:periplasmic copper chaperone A